MGRRRRHLGHERNLRDNGSGKKYLNVDSSQKPMLRIDSLHHAGDSAVGDVGTNDFICHYDTMPVDDGYMMEDYFETQLLDPSGETQMVDPEGETQLVDLAGETQLVDLAGETQMVDPEGEIQLVDLAGETQLVDPVGETQLVDPVGETQLVDLLEETQLVDLAGETQVVDELDCVQNMQTEFFNDIDSTNKMEDMCETQVLSQDDTDKIDGCGSFKLEDTAHSHPLKQGSVPKGFTSIRAASIRASGWAARARGAKNSMLTSGDDETYPERRSCEHDISSPVGSLLESGQIQNKNDEMNEQKNNLKKFKVGGGTAMRKLFREDDVEFGQLDVDADNRDDNPDIPEMPTQNCFAGLSYADSQEPGELSQAHALEVVDRFLDINAMELEESLGRRVHNTEKSNIVSGAKGSLNLAKSTILKSTEEGHGTYDWDNTREDEGGGDFFRKTKELFFKKGATAPRKARPHDTGSVDSLVNFGDKKEQHTTDKIGDTVYSDSRLMLHKLRARGNSCNSKGNLLHKNVVKNLDEQLIKVFGPELTENHIFKDVTIMDNIGPDTQMAAEAMENLCFELQINDNNNSNNTSNKCTSWPAKGTTRKRNREPPLDEQPTTKAPYPTRAGVARQAKQKKRASIEPSNEPSLSQKQFKKRKNHNSVLGKAEQRKMIETNSTRQQSAPKSLSKDLRNSSVAAANQTGKRTELNHPAKANDSFHHGKDINDLISVNVLRKKRTSTKPRNAKIITIKQLKKLGLSALDQPYKTCVSTPIAINIDAVAGGQGKRSRQDEVDKYSGKFEIPRGGQESNAEKSAEGAYKNGKLEASPGEKCGISTPACRTPVTCVTPVSKPSPILMGDEYHKQSCRKSTSKSCLIKDISNLATTSPGLYGGTKELRKRKDITQIKVLFSQHLDEDVVKQQKKILSRLGGAVAPIMFEATHFVADEFVRTRNMLEAIACGKPVVTHLWLESCGQAHCLIDEKNYILRDAKKEKEFGFCLPVSLARACQHPLLQGKKVYITPNTKPGKDILANLVKAVHGLPIERLGRSVLKDEKLPEDLLILSCEEDYDSCVPFLEKGGVVYSSELLLNGIVKQKLEHERHQLFSEHVKRTRSTIWVKQKNQYRPAAKCK